MLAITLLTFKEVIRRRILLITLFLTLVFWPCLGQGSTTVTRKWPGRPGRWRWC